MRAVVQRISQGEVRVEGQVIGKAGKGLMVLVGFNQEDLTDSSGLTYIRDKVLNLRIFEDDEDKMNLSVQDIEGDLLIVPNFTLYGDCRKGRRPSFSNSASAQVASELYSRFISELEEKFSRVASGEFQADMAVDIINDGPVTLLLDSSKIL